MMIYCIRKVDESVERIRKSSRSNMMIYYTRKVDESVEHDDLLHTEGRRVGRT